MFPLSPTAWLAVGGALLVVGLGAAVKIQTGRLDGCKADAAAFQATVRAEGLAAENAARIADLAHQKAKEQADATAKKLLADNAVLGKRLRDARASSGYVPPAAASARSPDTACFDRTELERAIGSLDAGVQSLVSQGDEARLKLSTAAEWAASLAR